MAIPAYGASQLDPRQSKRLNASGLVPFLPGVCAASPPAPAVAPPQPQPSTQPSPQPLPQPQRSRGKRDASPTTQHFCEASLWQR